MKLRITPAVGEAAGFLGAAALFLSPFLAMYALAAACWAVDAYAERCGVLRTLLGALSAAESLGGLYLLACTGVVWAVVIAWGTVQFGLALYRWLSHARRPTCHRHCPLCARIADRSAR